jgi:hypothetical protein
LGIVVTRAAVVPSTDLTAELLRLVLDVRLQEKGAGIEQERSEYDGNPIRARPRSRAIQLHNTKFPKLAIFWVPEAAD